MAGTITKRTLEDIRFGNDIVDVIGSYFTLKRSGSSFKANCPFHKEKTPSFHVNPQRQIYHCFGCGAGGDVFEFIMKYEGVDFAAAAVMLAQRAGITLELDQAAQTGQGPDKAMLYKIHEEIALFYQRCLLQMETAEHARKYLAQRKLTKEIADEFLIGYAPDRWDAAIKWAEKKHYKIDLLEEAGLILKSSKPGAELRFYDRFRNRLMFPIRDAQGRVIAFSARALDEKDKSAKYVNSPETALFKKSRVLYCLDKARRHIVESHEAILCEGQIDVIRCHQAGFCAAVASQGTAFTDDHASILKRYADSVCIVFDPDHAGQDAAIRTAALFMVSGLAVRIAVLPPREDPDSFIIKHGAEAFQKILDTAMSATAFQIQILSEREKADTEIGAMRIAKAVLETISHSPNAVQRAKLIQETAERLSIPASALNDDLRQIVNKRQRSSGRDNDVAKAQSASESKMPAEEIALCEHMVHITDHPDISPVVRKYLPLDMIENALCRALVKASIQSLEDGRGIQEIIREYDEFSEELQRFAAKVQMAPTKTVGEFIRLDSVKDVILRLWQKKLKALRAELEKQKIDEKLRHQMTCDLRALKNWEDGSAVIELHLAEGGAGG